jgi:type IV secretory pathway TrbD component
MADKKGFGTGRTILFVATILIGLLAILVGLAIDKWIVVGGGVGFILVAILDLIFNRH